MDAYFACASAESFQWIPELEMGYCPARPDKNPYDDAYYQQYVKYARTDMGAQLTSARMELVARHYRGPLVDVGVGSGQFCLARPDTRGYDVNPIAVDWLKAHGLWHDFYGTRCRAATFWDSLEHIPDPGAALAQVQQRAFVSLPLFMGMYDVMQSKHFKPNEHIWYWTVRGFKRWVRAQGFDVCEVNRVETGLGREGIWSFALERI